ncbi:DNA-binding LacI/PurR family transcriptional regulator [Frondihabitans sp. PhB188]|uniref:LacI family DNA-binding transcriptional regulator n=1 Tax=Frondihabitans sp. PhB188 TaxID=2485200 RepID=UPI000F47E863|nr:LacI family DNA-binding transcriptional regulator [Frondihabitans sp. PhB188]ROQ37159.1 DNA-binding LacI/PurR family transcriptional regulator [Frondihabitans sp. PhB188]
MSIATRPTLASVAKLAGVSASTASLAFNDSGPVSASTREKVLDAARTLGYAGPDPRARSLRRGRSGIVGVVLEESLRDAFRDPMNLAMLDGIADLTGPAGNSLLLLTETAAGRSTLVDAPVDAAVLFGCSPVVDEKVAILLRRGIPVVAIEGRPIPGVLDIGLDNREATRSLAEHLKGLGHSDVALVTLELDRDRRRSRVTQKLLARATSHTALERVHGAREVFPAAGGLTTLGSTVDEGRIAGLALLGDPETRPTAVIAQSDLLAVGVIRAAAELGLAVPGDLSVVGFDGVRIDDPVAAELTTMVQPGFAKGQAAGRGILELLAGREGRSVSFTSAFRRGATTAPPR